MCLHRYIYGNNDENNYWLRKGSFTPDLRMLCAVLTAYHTLLST